MIYSNDLFKSVYNSAIAPCAFQPELEWPRKPLPGKIMPRNLSMIDRKNKRKNPDSNLQASLAPACMLTLHARLQLRALIQPNLVLHSMGSGIHSTPRTLPSPPAAAAAACCYALLHHCRPPLPRRRERACKNCMRLERERAPE